VAQGQPAIHPHMTGETESNQRARLVSFAAVMNHQTRTGTASAAVKAIAPENVLAESAEEAQGMVAPVVARMTAARTG
jgi:hypothetical protein